jgi:hypothetical protein
MTARQRCMRQLAGALAGCLFLAFVLAGCTSARNSLGTSDSSCYLALPTATSAVRAHGRLLGVHLFDQKVLRQRAPHLFTALDTTYHASQRVCVVAYSGNFTRHSVSAPRGRSSGRLAVVVATTPANHLLGTVIFARPPLHFGHPHIG